MLFNIACCPSATDENTIRLEFKVENVYKMTVVGKEEERKHIQAKYYASTLSFSTVLQPDRESISILVLYVAFNVVVVA